MKLHILLCWCINACFVQVRQVIEEENMLEAFNMIELYCNRLIEHAAQLDKPQYVSFFTPSCLSYFFLMSDDIGVDFVLMFGYIDSLQFYGCLTIFYFECSECDEDIREAAAGITFAAGWCSDLPELMLARTILANKFGSDFAATAKEGTGAVDPMVIRT
jgi:hypothetical protein